MNIQLIGTSTHDLDKHLYLDITDHKSVQKVIEKITPDCVINCAAMTNVEACETDPESARRLNSLGPLNIAKVCAPVKIRFIQISTDSVFDGISDIYTEDSVAAPLNTYARTKLEGENSVASICEDYLILRTNFYGISPRKVNFLDWILKNLVERRSITGVTDVRFNPVWVKDLAAIILELALHSCTGILNCSGDEIFSKYEFIRTVARELGYEDSTIKKGFSKDIFKNAKRPSNTVLDNHKLRKLMNVKISRVHEVLSGLEFDKYRAEETGEI
jgi:dTDP-4-dehydrorhamnose reductase